ncbi:MAG: hypothetical protein AAF802_02355 [Planctomycetota bacterium]
MTTRQTVALGAFVWLIAIGLITVFAVRNTGDPETENPLRSVAGSIARFSTGQHETYQLVDEGMLLRSGDPVFLAEPDGGFRGAGFVQEIIKTKEGREITMLWYDAEISPDECQLFQYGQTGTLAEVAETMLTPAKRNLIRQRLSRVMRAHGDEVTRSLEPLIRQSMSWSMPVIEDSFRRAVANNRSEIDRVSAKWNDQVIKQRLVPLAKAQILPIVKRHGRPPAEKIGKKVWDQASLFRFGWRAVYDKTPLPKRDLLREEWSRFVEKEAIPILEAHTDEIVVAIERSFRDVAKNPTVRRELAEAAEKIAEDPESRRLVTKILRETFVDNEQLKQVWRDVWTSEEADRAMNITNARLEPVIRQIGDDLFGSREQGIDPDFARVLRSQILLKDRRWIVAWLTGANSGEVKVAKKRMPFPVIYAASPDEEMMGVRNE